MLTFQNVHVYIFIVKFIFMSCFQHRDTPENNASLQFEFSAENKKVST